MDIAQAMMIVEYKGYRINVSPVGNGWRALIFSPGSSRALPESPSNLEKSRSEEIIAEPSGLSMRDSIRDRCNHLGKQPPASIANWNIGRGTFHRNGLRAYRRIVVFPG